MKCTDSWELVNEISGNADPVGCGKGKKICFTCKLKIASFLKKGEILFPWFEMTRRQIEVTIKLT